MTKTLFLIVATLVAGMSPAYASGMGDGMKDGMKADAAMAADGMKQDSMMADGMSKDGMPKDSHEGDHKMMSGDGHGATGAMSDDGMMSKDEGMADGMK